MGKVYLVGAGPGAVDLLTLRATRLLASADIVFHDALVEQAVLDLAPAAIRIAVGKRCGVHSTSQRFINKRLVDAAARHAIVVRLKGGDPMLFGRAQEEIDALAAAGVAFEVVPGVTAALAAASDLKLSLTRRGVARSVTMVTPRVGEGESAHAWSRAAASADTAVIYMGAGQTEAIAAALVAQGLSPRTPVVLVEDAGRATESHCAGELAALPLLAATRGTGPAVIVLGEIARAMAEAAALPGERCALAQAAG
jgi:uroporphyrin-III C-methyltransferase